jgi:N-acetylmuramoyl-L-alanine amidase
MRSLRCLWMLPLILTAVGAAADVEPSATRIVINGQSRIYRTYGWAKEPEVFAPIARDLQRFGLVSEWQPGQEQVTLGCNGTVSRWHVARSRYEIRVDASRVGDLSQAEALEMGGELFLPVRTTVGMLGGSVTWDESRRSLVVQISGARLAPAGAPWRRPEGDASRADLAPAGRDLRGAARGNAATSGCACLTHLQWSEQDGGLSLEVEATAPVHAQLLQLANPNRLVIDFRPAIFRLSDALGPRGPVRNVRTGQFEAQVARVVLDLGTAHLGGAGVPAAAQTSFSIRLAGSSGPAQPIAVVPRSAPSSASSILRTRKLASRGGVQGRDLDRLKQVLGAGEGVLRGKVICIDAGHGGHSSGAMGVTGLWEKDLTLRMALEAARALQEAGATVIMTRGDDTYVSLEDRVDIANQRGADVFISIHCNSMPHMNMMSGTESYYCTAHSLDLARALHPQIVGVMAGRDGGIRRRGFFVIKHTQMPSVLLEVGYINQNDDEQKLADTENQRSIGSAVRDGVVRYFSR